MRHYSEGIWYLFIWHPSKEDNTIPMDIDTVRPFSASMDS